MKAIFAVAMLAASLPAFAANVSVSDAWARATMPGQQVSGAYMKIESDADARLIGASSPAVPRVEVHEMKMDGDVMRMRALPNGLALPAGKTVALTPGGYHVMLMDLKATLPKDSTIPLTLTFKNAKAIQDTARRVPAERLLVETDAPYLAPVPYRGKPNHPAWVRRVAEFVAQLRGETLEQIATVTTTNYRRLFGLPAEAA